MQQLNLKPSKQFNGHDIYFFEFFEGINPFCRVTDMPVLDCSGTQWMPQVTYGATSADLLTVRAFSDPCTFFFKNWWDSNPCQGAPAEDLDRKILDAPKVKFSS